MKEIAIKIAQYVHWLFTELLHIERRLEPFFRPALNRVAREPMARAIQFLINIQRKDEGLGLAEEKHYAWEEET